MSNVPQLSRFSDPDNRSRNSNRWIDLIAFLAVLALGGVLIALGSTTAGSLATICAALGGLYAVWKRFSSSGKASSSDEVGREHDEDPPGPAAG